MKKKKNQLFITGGLVALLVAVFIVMMLLEGAEKDAQTEGNIEILKEEITEKASFYSYEMDGTALEVMAVKATDGTVRTAFNTCQVCYSSGRGYYKQNGTYLVCQNCGNAYISDEVELMTGGCNPVPIMESDKTETSDKIIISRELLEKYQVIFANWKTNY